MARKYVECRDYVGAKCTVSLVADSEAELIDAAMYYGAKAYGLLDDASTREKIRRAVKSGCPSGC